MPNKKKLNLERFKKSTQGLIDFAKLIEQATPSMQKNIIEQTQKEDPEFLEKVMKRLIYFEELIYLDAGIIAEILSTIPPKVLAYSIRTMPEEFRKTVLEQVGFRQLRQVQDEEDKMGPNPASGLVVGAQKHILKVARKLESENKFVIEPGDCPRLNPEKKQAA